MPTLVVSRADGSTENYPVDEEIITIGRHPDSTVVLKAASASSQHAALRQREDGQYYLQDLGSSNGTRVNDVLIEETVLRDADQIAFGDEAAAFFMVEVNAAASQPLYADPVVAAPVVEPVVPVATPVSSRVAAPVAMPRARPPRVRSYHQMDEGTGCTTIFIVSMLFIFAFFLGLTLRHYNLTGHFLLGDIVERMTSGGSKLNIQMQEKRDHP